MVTFTLEEHPDLFLAPKYFNDKFTYGLHQFHGEGSQTVVHDIDLRSDKLMIYGIEIKDSTLERLYQSFIFKKQKGCAFVNCHGACHFLVYEKGYCTPIHNVIFDWSRLGVEVPDSINDSLRKQLEQKEKEVCEMNHRLSSVEAEASSMKAALVASKKEVEELKQQLDACQRERNDKEAKLQKLELSEERVTKLEENLSACNEERQNMEVELQKAQSQLSLVNSELQSTKTVLDSSIKLVKESEDLVSFYRKESQAKQVEQQKAQDELASVHLELCSTESKLESSKERVKELEEQLCAIKMESKDQLSLVIHEVQFTKSMLESEVKSINKKLEDMLHELNHRCCSQSRIQCPSVSYLSTPFSPSNQTMSVAIDEDVLVQCLNETAHTSVNVD